MDPLLIAILFFILAITLAAADLLVPSGGVLAIVSLLAALISIYFGFRSSPSAGLMMLVLILLAIPVFLVVAIRIWPYTPIGRRVILKAPAAAESVESSAAEPQAEFIGQVGVAQNPLMPSGHVRINHRNYNAITEGNIIEAGQNVEVVAIRQRNLVVVSTRKAVTQASAGSTGPSANENASVAAPKLGESLLDQPAEELGLDSLE